MQAQSLMNLAYGLHHVQEIIPSNSTKYKWNNILFITKMETSNDRFTNVDVSMAPVRKLAPLTTRSIS